MDLLCFICLSLYCVLFCVYTCILCRLPFLSFLYFCSVFSFSTLILLVGSFDLYNCLPDNLYCVVETLSTAQSYQICKIRTYFTVSRHCELCGEEQPVPLPPARGQGRAVTCKFPAGLGQCPSQNRVWCILALKSDIWWQQLELFS